MPLTGTNSISNSQYPIDIRVVHSEKGRSKQLNLGASHARGKILLFVHGDTRLPVGYDAMVRRCLVAGNQSRGRKRRVVAGAFSFEIEDKEQVLLNYGKAILEYSTNLRAKYLQMPYGDQVISGCLCIFLPFINILISVPILLDRCLPIATWIS